MANNSYRKAIEFMVQGALPPHSTNVLWMDTSVQESPVLKIFWNGVWTSVHTEDSGSSDKLIEILDKLTDTNARQEGTINTLTQQVLVALSGVAEEAQATLNKNEILAAIPTECSDEDIDHMFMAVSEDDYIIVPEEIITQDGTMPISVFTALTNLTPIE